MIPITEGQEGVCQFGRCAAGSSLECPLCEQEYCAAHAPFHRCGKCWRCGGVGAIRSGPGRHAEPMHCPECGGDGRVIMDCVPDRAPLQCVECEFVTNDDDAWHMHALDTGHTLPDEG